MRKYIIRRLLISVVILFFVALIIYSIMRLMPASFVENLARQRASTPGAVRTYQDWLDQLNALYGLDKGLIPGFFGWLSHAIRFDFGESWLFGIPVTQKFAQVVGDSAYLIGVVTVLEYALALPLGMVAAHKQYSKTDYAVTIFAVLGISLPSFFLATLMKLVFSVKLGWFDLYGKVSRNFYELTPFFQVLDIAYHYVLPILTLTIVGMGSLMRYTRTNMLEVLSSDYIRTARAKGLPEGRVLRHHAFRNTLIPVVTMLGGLLPAMFSGAMITEIMFQIPGIGYTSYQAILGGDIPFAMFYMVFIALLTLIGTFIADILYAVVDPRVRIA
jgi:peptide/nickel transport system permease protein